MLSFQAPKSFKSGRLIMGIYSVKDMILLIVTILISFTLVIVNLLATGNSADHIYLIASTILFVIPSAVVFAGLQPAGVYHNNFGMLREFLSFRKRRKQLSWEGIYKHDEEYEEENN